MNAAARTTTQGLTGPQKAALVILGLDEAVAVEVLKHLDEADMARLAETVTGLDPIPVDSLDFAYEDFLGRMRAPALGPKDGAAYVRKLASAAMGEERANRLLSPAKARTPLDALRGARSGALAELLADEHPQICAVVLAQLGRDQAAKVLMALPSEKQDAIVARLAALESVPARAAQLASETLARALSSDGDAGGEAGEFDGVGFVAGLLNEVPPTESERLLGAIEAQGDDLAPKVRQKMFTFEDLLRVPARSLQVLMREVATESLLVALKTASEPLRDHFLSGVSSRAATQMREDLSALPPMRLSDVERAQREIVETAMRLSQEGRLTLPGPASERLV